MDFVKDKIRPLYFRYLGAAFGSALITSIYSIVDMSMVGQYQGPDGTAALAVVAPVWNIIYSLGLLTGIGGSVLFGTTRGKSKVPTGRENEYFTVFLPFFSEYPYGVNIYAKRHISNITELTDAEKQAFAKTLKETAGMLDALFDYKFPYMMCMYNAPVNGEDASDYYHFHVSFYPPMRSRDKQKFNASSETGAWAHCNPTAPEEKAEELRAAHKKFVDSLQ